MLPKAKWSVFSLLIFISPYPYIITSSPRLKSQGFIDFGPINSSVSSLEDFTCKLFLQLLQFHNWHSHFLALGNEHFNHLVYLMRGSSGSNKPKWRYYYHFCSLKVNCCLCPGLRNFLKLKSSCNISFKKSCPLWKWQ